MLPDIQKTSPNHMIELERVGITNFKLPITLINNSNGYQHTVASVDCFVSLSADKKGINMSRIPIGIQHFSNKVFNVSLLKEIASHIKNKSEAERCQIIYKFPYFVEKIAPSSKLQGIVYYNVVFSTTVDDANNYKSLMSVEVVGTSNCPCSKEISMDSNGNGQGAHGQRSRIKMTIELNESFIWIEDLISIGEKSCSCELYSVLKRPDEQIVTINAYNNPKFVEDIVRECYNNIKSNLDVKNVTVEVYNEESIHLHDAVAFKSSDSTFDIKI